MEPWMYINYVRIYKKRTGIPIYIGARSNLQRANERNRHTYIGAGEEFGITRKKFHKYFLSR